MSKGMLVIFGSYIFHTVSPIGKRAYNRYSALHQLLVAALQRHNFTTNHPSLTSRGQVCYPLEETKILEKASAESFDRYRRTQIL
jgi:hypothetical protein